MQDDLLQGALQQLRKADAPVRAAALLRISRALAVQDPAEARALLGQSLALTGELSRVAPSRAALKQQPLFDEAREVAAAVDPTQLPHIPAASFGSMRDHFEAGQIVQSMLAYGRLDDAFAYLMRLDQPSAFPFAWLGNILHELGELCPGDPGRRLLLLRRAVDMWRRSPSGPFHHERDQFLRLFGFFWKEFPQDEALAITRMLVDRTLAEADLGTSADYMHQVHFSSSRQHKLFQLLHTLRHLDPPLAQTLVDSHEQLNTAAQRYPHGLETMNAVVEAESEKRKNDGITCEGAGFLFAGNPADFDRQRRLFEASRSGDFSAALRDAREKLDEDASPTHRNYAPKAYWPSTGAFRRLLYDAGKRLGRDAAALLDQIPDDDVRLFATIELAAALNGSPPSSIRQMTQPNPPDRPLSVGRIISSQTRVRGRLGATTVRSPDGRIIQCPRCSSQPSDDVRWTCSCGHVWNTFWTGGNCPACHHQWTETQCPACGELSDHKRWYITEN